jgi:hypothetical protein
MQYEKLRGSVDDNKERECCALLENHCDIEENTEKHPAKRVGILIEVRIIFRQNK